MEIFLGELVFNESAALANSSLHNVTNTTDADVDVDELYDKTGELYYIAYGVVMLSICVLGILGNSLNLVVFGRGRFHSVTYTLFKVLAVADLLAMLLWLPEVLRLGFYVFGEDGMPHRFMAFYYAHCSFPLINTFIITGSLIVLVVSVERFVAICHPLNVKRFGVSRRIHLILLLCFLMPTLLYVPSVFEYDVVKVSSTTHFTKTWNADYADAISYKVYKWVRISLIRFIPIVVIVALNTMSAKEFAKILRRRDTLTRRSHRRVVKTNQAQLNIAESSNSRDQLCESNHLYDKPSPQTPAATTHNTTHDSDGMNELPHTTGSGAKNRTQHTPQREDRRESAAARIGHRLRGIGHSVRALTSSLHRQRSSRQKEQDERSKTMMMIAIAIQYVICMLPVAIYHMLVDSDLRGEWEFRVFTTIADILDLLNSALNFYTYALASRDFRKQFKIIFHLRSRHASKVGTVSECGVAIATGGEIDNAL